MTAKHKDSCGTGCVKLRLVARFSHSLHRRRITRSKSRTVQLQLTDIDGFAAYQLRDIQPGETAELLLPFEPLSKTVKGCATTDQIVLTHRTDRPALRYGLDGRHVEQPLTAADLGDLPVRADHRYTMPVDEHFKEALHKAFECCTDESSRPPAPSTSTASAQSLCHVKPEDATHADHISNTKAGRGRPCTWRRTGRATSRMARGRWLCESWQARASTRGLPARLRRHPCTGPPAATTCRCWPRCSTLVRTSKRPGQSSELTLP